MGRRAVADGAIILAGGPSSRMGEPKALVEVSGQPMLVLILRALHSAGIPQAILSFKDEEQAAGVVTTLGKEEVGNGISMIHDCSMPVRLVFDDELSQGRNSAVRGMREPAQVAHNLGWNAVQMVPCDVPFVEPALFTLLHGKLSRHKECAVARSNSGLEPLLFCAKTAALNLALNDMSLAAHQVIARMKSVEVGPSEWGAAGITDRCFTNVNSRGDLKFLS
jgi:molybdopterin-guanine dinucleotide biosynthesis protein A